MKAYSRKRMLDKMISRRRVADAKCQIRRYKDAARYFRDMATAKQVALKAASLAKKAAKSASNPAAAEELSVIARIGQKVAIGKEKVVTLAQRIKNALAGALRTIAKPFQKLFQLISDKLFDLKMRYQTWKMVREIRKIGKGYDKISNDLISGVNKAASRLK